MDLHGGDSAGCVGGSRRQLHAHVHLPAGQGRLSGDLAVELLGDQAAQLLKREARLAELGGRDKLILGFGGRQVRPDVGQTRDLSERGQHGTIGLVQRRLIGRVDVHLHLVAAGASLTLTHAYPGRPGVLLESVLDSLEGLVVGAVVDHHKHLRSGRVGRAVEFSAMVMLTGKLGLEDWSKRLILSWGTSAMEPRKKTPAAASVTRRWEVAQRMMGTYTR